MILFIITLSFLGALSLCANKRNIMAPTNMVCAVFLVGAFFALIEAKSWGYSFENITTIIIGLSILSMIFGGLVANFLYTKIEKTLNDKRFKAVEVKTPSVASILILTAVLFCTAYIYYMDSYEAIIATGQQISKTDVISVSRLTKAMSLYDVFHYKRINTYLQYFRKAVSYVCIYVFLLNVIIKRESLIKRIYLLFPVIPFIMTVFFTGWRQEYIFLVTYTVTVFGILFIRGNGNGLKTFVILLMIAAGSIISLAFTFILIRTMLKGAWTGLEDAIRYFAVYSGGGIVEFNELLKEPIQHPEIFGLHTLQNIYSKLRRLGLDAPDITVYIYEFRAAGNLWTNIYTAFRRYIEDYGYIGCYCICFFIGLIYTFAFDIVIFFKNKHLPLMIYAALIFPLFVMPSEDYLFMYLIDTTPIYIILGILITYFLLIFKRGYK